MKSLLIYLKDYKKESILAPLFKMLEASFELLVPLVMAAVIDVGIADKNERYIIKMCMVLIALGLIGLVCSITAQYFSAKAASGFGTGVRHALFEHIQSLTFTEMDMIGSSTLITRLTSDINQTQAAIPEVAVYCIRCYDHGIYCRRTGCADLCCSHTDPVGDRIRSYACDHAPVQESTVPS